MGLKRIVLRDFVIISELDLDLSNGFTVLTGETGAGKSILIDALQLVTGGRADVGLIREGSSRTDVSAEFDAPEGLLTWLEAAGFELSEYLLLRRTIDTHGKSRAWINGSPATATQLRQIGEQLLDIHGQHAWQSLTHPDSVKGLLDAYAQVSSSVLESLWQRWRHAQLALEQAHTAQESLQSERERLAWQIGEVEKLAPLANEWDLLNAEHSRLSNAQALMDAAQSATQTLDAEDSSAIAAIHGASQLLGQYGHVEPHFKDFAEALTSSLAQVEDTIHSLRAYLRKAELDPQRLGELDSRLAMWIALARRYKRTPADLPNLLSAWRLEQERLNETSDLKKLEASCEAAQSAYLNEAHLLSEARRAAAPKLAKAITLSMQGLGMQGGQFEVALQKTEQPQQSGLEDVAFLVAGHAGSSPRQVNKVASGGELSRIALAIAVTTSQLGKAQTLIFDEVDAGVGGTVADTVGRLMKQLGLDRQVLTVTHLPQVAACADQHLVVAKQFHQNATISSVSLVKGEARVSEVARMLGGERLSNTTLAHAREMLETRQ
ncbi:MAG: DNA repair protein RecN [Rhodoferax sp.]|nr:DNA repair protein RecN [Rhodoferax sp.]